MFKIIEPEYHCFYKPRIDRFMELMQSCSTDLSQQDQNRATFILADGRDNGVDGGALLVKKRLNDFPSELGEALSDFLSPKEPIWQCIISISFESDSSPYTTGEVEFFCKTFYRNLYGALVKFGKKENTGFLCVSLDPREYLCTEELIFWPYVFELKSRDSSDGFFHGILPLVGSQYEAYKYRSSPRFRLRISGKGT